MRGAADVRSDACPARRIPCNPSGLLQHVTAAPAYQCRLGAPLAAGATAGAPPAAAAEGEAQPKKKNDKKKRRAAEAAPEQQQEEQPQKRAKKDKAGKAGKAAAAAPALLAAVGDRELAASRPPLVKELYTEAAEVAATSAAAVAAWREERRIAVEGCDPDVRPITSFAQSGERPAERVPC